mgnify:CR=1 FL=1
MEWTKLGIIDYFDTLSNIKTFRHGLKGDECNLWVNDVSKLINFLLILFLTILERNTNYEVLPTDKNRIHFPTAFHNGAGY